MKRDDAYYHLNLHSMDARIYESMGRIQRIQFGKDTCLRVDAIENGPVFLQNRGASKLRAVVHMGSLKESIELAPGELQRIPDSSVKKE
jgi:hypothetical protein